MSTSKLMTAFNLTNEAAAHGESRVVSGSHWGQDTTFKVVRINGHFDVQTVTGPPVDWDYHPSEVVETVCLLLR